MLTRRHFLRRLGIAAATLPALPLLTQVRAAAPAPAQKPLHVLILGAGLAGLSAAYELQKKGHKVTLLEAERTHLGGRARTLRFQNGLYGEVGAMRVPATHDLTRNYIKEMNLTLRPFVQSNPNAFTFARNTRVRNKDQKQLNALYKLTPGEKEMSSDDLWAAVVATKLKSFSPAERADFLATTPVTPAFKSLDQLSLQNLFDQSPLSQEAIELMAITQGQEAEMQYACTESLREEIKEIWAHEFDEIVGGTDLLPAALAKAIQAKGADLRQGCEVTALSQTATAVTATYLADGMPQTIFADRCLCTLPAPVLQRLDTNFSPEKTRAIRQMMYDSATKLLITAKRRFWETDDGIYGGGTYTDLPSGSTYYPADNALDRAGKGPRDVALSAQPAVFLASYSWGMAARRLAAAPHAQRLATITRHLSKIHPQLNDSDMITGSASWSWDTHPWSGGAFAWFNPNQHTTLYADLIKPEGRIHFAGEHASLTHTWMQGAFESTLRAVAEILV